MTSRPRKGTHVVADQMRDSLHEGHDHEHGMWLTRPLVLVGAEAALVRALWLLAFVNGVLFILQGVAWFIGFLL